MDEAPVSSRPVNQARNRREKGGISGGGQGQKTRNMTAQWRAQCGITLVLWAGAADAHGLTCSGLIPALVLRLLLHQPAGPSLIPIIPVRLELT